MSRIRKSHNKPFLSNRELTLLLLILLISVFATIVKKDAFLSVNNLEAIFTGMSFDLLIAIGMTLILILGGIDLSVGSVIAFVSVNSTLLLQAGKPLGYCISVGLLIAAFIGLINGLMIVKANIPPFIMTLGSTTIFRGLSYVQTSGYYVNKLPSSFVDIGRGSLLGIPNIVVISLLVFLVVAFLIHKSKYFFQYYYIGSSPDAAYLSGIPASVLTISGYILCSILAGVSGLLMSSRMAMGYAGFGIGAEMRAIAAVVIGGASMHGGDGSIVGTVLGVILIALINNVFIMMNGSANWQTAISGIVLIFALVLDLLRGRIRMRELPTEKAVKP